MDQTKTILAGLACGIRDWWDFAGDPWVSGTVFMAAYALTAFLIFRAARLCWDREYGFWRLCGWLMTFQVANTHLDLHGIVFTTGRCLSRAQGWYENRREVQMLVLAGLTLVVLAILLVVLIVYFRNIFGNMLLSLGVVTALGFTVVKAINLHGLEAYYAGQYGPFRGADLIELSGIGLAFLAAVFRLVRRGLFGGGE